MKEVSASRHEFLSNFDRISHEIIPGDILLIEGTNRVSEVIKNFTHSPWTHAALYIGRLHSIEDPKMRELVRKHYHGSAQQQLLVETIIGKNMEINPISIYKHHHIRICRPMGISHSDSQNVINFAIKRLGHTYNVRHIFDLGRFMMAGRWFMPHRWRSSLFENEPSEATKDICSSMLAEAFLSVKFPILPLIRRKKEDGGGGRDRDEYEIINRNPKLFIPSDFDYSPYFSIIKYPMFALEGPGPYRDLPWNEDLISHDDEGIVASKRKPPQDED